MVLLSISELIELSQTNFIGMFIALAIILILFATVALIILRFIPILAELKSFIVGLVVMIGLIVWVNIYIIP